MKIIYQENDMILEEDEGRFFLQTGKDTYRLLDQVYGPFLYLKGNGKMTAVRHAFTVEELCKAIETDGTITMITGNTYDKSGVFRLLRKAAELGRDSIDIAYAEGHCFMDYMKERGAYTEETAIDLSEAGMKNPDSLNTFIHSKKVCRTSDGRFFLPDAQSRETLSENRLISDLLRFGCGYRTLPEGRQYYAWHGSPDRNDDWIIYAEITESEYHRISIEYTQLISADRDTADRFRDKYIRGHKILKEGWNVSL